MPVTTFCLPGRTLGAHEMNSLKKRDLRLYIFVQFEDRETQLVVLYKILGDVRRHRTLLSWGQCPPSPGITARGFECQEIPLML